MQVELKVEPLEVESQIKTMKQEGNHKNLSLLRKRNLSMNIVLLEIDQRGLRGY